MSSRFVELLAPHVADPLRIEFERIIVGPATVGMRLQVRDGSRWRPLGPIIFPTQDSTQPRGDLLRALAATLDELDATPCPAPYCRLPAGHRDLHDIPVALEWSCHVRPVELADDLPALRAVVAVIAGEQGYELTATTTLDVTRHEPGTIDGQPIIAETEQGVPIPELPILRVQCRVIPARRVKT